MRRQQLDQTMELAGPRTTRIARAAAGALAAIPALLLALTSLGLIAYFIGLFRPLIGEFGAIISIDPGDANPGFDVLSALGIGALGVGLLNGKAVAWWLTVATLAVTLVFRLSTSAHPLGIVLAGGFLAVLLADRRRYEVETAANWRRRILALLAMAAVLIGLETCLTIAATGAWPGPFATIGDATTALGNAFGVSDEAAARLLRVSSHNGLLALLVVAARLPVMLAAIGVLTRVPEPPADPSTRTRARDIAKRFGSGALLGFQLGDDKFVYSPPEREGLVVYGVVGGTAVALGDPICPPEQAPETLSAFLARCRKVGRNAVFYQASESGKVSLTNAGLRLFRVGVEAIIDLGSFDLAGSRRANLRHTITRCRKTGVSIRWFAEGLDANAEPGLIDQLAAIDQAWRAQAGPELGFTISHFDLGILARQPVAIAVGEDGRALGFTTFRPTGADGGWVLDLMRRTTDSPPGVVEFCIAEAASAFRTAGSPTLSLGLAPLAGLDTAGPFEERFLAVGARLVGRWYDVKGLWFFKSKFDPTWVPRYGAIRHRRDFVRFIVALLLVHVKITSLLPGRVSSDRVPSFKATS